MAIPTSVQQVLDQWNVEFSVTDLSAPDPFMNVLPAERPQPSSVAQVVILADEDGQIQVVLPSDRILDLNQIGHQLGRRLNAISPADAEKLKLKLGLDEFPALPQLTNLETLVDKALLDKDELFIQSGAEQNWLKLPREQFRSLTANSVLGHYSAPVQSDVLHQSYHEDVIDIHQAVQQFTPLRVQQRLQDTLDLPPLPDTARKIIDLRIDPNADTLSLARVVETDPSMSAQIISWARSPFYGSRGQIRTVEEAVLRVLGFDLVMNLSLGLALGKTLSVPREGPRGYQTFWYQAVVTAALTDEICKLARPRTPLDSGIAYLCGLLHNFGFLVLGHVFPPQFSLVNRHIEANPHINRLFIERHLLGLTREQVAASLMQQWNMPEEVVVAIRHQHNPYYRGEHKEYARLLYLVTRSLRQQQFGDGPLEGIEASCIEPLGLEPEELQEATATMMGRLGELQNLVSTLSANG